MACSLDVSNDTGAFPCLFSSNHLAILLSSLRYLAKKVQCQCQCQKPKLTGFTRQLAMKQKIKPISWLNHTFGWGGFGRQYSSTWIHLYTYLIRKGALVIMMSYFIPGNAPNSECVIIGATEDFVPANLQTSNDVFIVTSEELLIFLWFATLSPIIIDLKYQESFSQETKRRRVSWAWPEGGPKLLLFSWPVFFLNRYLPNSWRGGGDCTHPRGKNVCQKKFWTSAWF